MPRTSDERIAWILRLGASLCFLGHGAFGLIGKAAWVPYFGVAGIAPDHAWSLMPLVGSVDILLAALVLLRPRPALLAYMTVWAVWTALLRPLSGESAWEAVERAGNYGVPFALLITQPLPANARAWFSGLRRAAWTAVATSRVRVTLVATTALLLLGHGMLAIGGKPGLVAHYAILDRAHASGLAQAGGAFELLLAVLVCVRPTPAIAIMAATWKLMTESLFLLAGAAAWEVVERGGSYAAPLALAVLLMATRAGAPAVPPGEAAPNLAARPGPT